MTRDQNRYWEGHSDGGKDMRERLEPKINELSSKLDSIQRTRGDLVKINIANCERIRELESRLDSVVEPMKALIEFARNAGFQDADILDKAYNAICPLGKITDADLQWAQDRAVEGRETDDDAHDCEHCGHEPDGHYGDCPVWESSAVERRERISVQCPRTMGCNREYGHDGDCDSEGLRRDISAIDVAARVAKQQLRVSVDEAESALQKIIDICDELDPPMERDT